MMELILKETGVVFKTIEKNMFEKHCRNAIQETQEYLEALDIQLMESRDKNLFRHKGSKETTVKTVYGDVPYSRRVYETVDENGERKYVYLLDEFLKIKHTGLISENLAEKIVSGITTKSYRDCADEVSETTAQNISAMGVWNLVQKVGEKLCEEEQRLVEQHKKNNCKGETIAPVLFEESDGISLSMQGKDIKTTGHGRSEMKVSIAYRGWKKIAKNRHLLDGKVVCAGFASRKKFYEIREAKIASEYALDETHVRLLNGDGASWIKKVPDKDTIFQLDPFHRNKAIKEKIHHTKARKDIMNLLQEEDIPEMFRYLELYRNSLDDDKEIADAETLIKYFSANADALIPYQSRVMLPEQPEGIEYRNMGTMENHMWSIIARRMKHNHTSWSKQGANNLAKILAKKSEGQLYKVTEKLKEQIVEADIEELPGDILQAKDNPERIGKGYAYPIAGSLPYMAEAVRGHGHTAWYK